MRSTQQRMFERTEKSWDDNFRISTECVVRSGMHAFQPDLRCMLREKNAKNMDKYKHKASVRKREREPNHLIHNFDLSVFWEVRQVDSVLMDRNVLWHWILACRRSCVAIKNSIHIVYIYPARSSQHLVSRSRKLNRWYMCSFTSCFRVSSYR